MDDHSERVLAYFNQFLCELVAFYFVVLPSRDHLGPRAKIMSKGRGT